MSGTLGSSGNGGIATWLESESQADGCDLMVSSEVVTTRGVVRRSADGWGFGLYDLSNEYRYWFRTMVDPERRLHEDPYSIQHDGLPVVGPSTLVWIGLNPSWSDDGKGPRATLRTVLKLAGREGYTGVLGVNLYAFRHTKPKNLTTRNRGDQQRMLGEHNDEILAHAFGQTTSVLAAWGSNGARLGRGAQVLGMVGDPLAVELLGSGEPGHPLYKRHDTPLERLSTLR